MRERERARDESAMYTIRLENTEFFDCTADVDLDGAAYVR